MNTKWKVIVSVMLLIMAICTVFIILVQKQHNDKVVEIIAGKRESAALLADTLLTEISKQYQKRIKGFVNPAVFPQREQMILAFADRDREKMLQLSKPFYTILKKENPFFASMVWCLPDNHIFLHVHTSVKHRKNVKKMRPDIAAVNREKRQYSGFDAGYMGMQYRIVQPVFYHDKYLGAVQFGIKASIIFDAMQDKLNTIAGMAILNDEYAVVQGPEIPKLKGPSHTIRSPNITMFQDKGDQLDWNRPQQRVVLDGKPHVILNVLPVVNFQNDILGTFFVALDISGELAQKRQLLLSVLLISALLLIISFLILYFSYGTLVQKIITLNRSLEKNNRELENRVRERTLKFQESEKRLQRARKMEAIGMMAGGVAHDLNNILSGIISYPELLLLQLPESSELREPIEAIHESGKRAATVVADLLTVARGAASTREPHDINVLIGEYLSSPEFKQLTSLHLEVECIKHLAAEYAIISCSSIHIKKTLMNLMTNAAEAIVDKGIIHISTSNMEVDILQGAEHDMEPGSYVVLTIQDDGPGISDNDLEHIFEPFYTRKVMGRSGTGLGLTVVWNTVQDHNGKILVESSAAGTSFQLYFPVNKEAQEAQPKDIEGITPIGNNESILIVDDELHLRNIACQILTTLNYRVESVSSGELALQFLQDNQVDLVVLDMLMEPGMNGRQTYEKILAIQPSQKAIIASGFSESDDVKEALGLGAGGFIKKPYSIDQLGRAVKEVLRS